MKKILLIIFVMFLFSSFSSFSMFRRSNFAPVDRSPHTGLLQGASVVQNVEGAPVVLDGGGAAAVPDEERIEE